VLNQHSMQDGEGLRSGRWQAPIIRWGSIGRHGAARGNGAG
jgi:hypothetical protein